MNRDEFYAAMAPNDDARLRKILWTVYWRGNAQLRERIEDELRPQDQPKVKPKKELPDPVGVLGEVTTFVELAKDGAYMAGDRRVHHTERVEVAAYVPPAGGRRAGGPDGQRPRSSTAGRHEDCRPGLRHEEIRLL
jgi:hypothetical protein